MNEETLNFQLRKYLKNVGVTSQREIERAVREAVDGGKLAGTETIDARMTLEIPAVGLVHRIDGQIALGD